MRNAIYWITIGGLSFWVPVIIIHSALWPELNVLTLNAIPLASLALLGAVSWIYTKRLPKWGWVLAGGYGVFAVLVKE